MKKNIIVLIALVVIIWIGISDFPPKVKWSDSFGNNPKNATFIIDGKRVSLKNGVAEMPIMEGSASKTITRYFGNEINADLDGDSDEDFAFILSQESGGSGIFYYAVATIKTEKGYIGTEGYLLGDRIAPQSTHLAVDTPEKYVFVINYADRAPNEPMTAKPSIGKSIYLKLDAQNLRLIPAFPNEPKSIE